MDINLKRFRMTTAAVAGITATTFLILFFTNCSTGRSAQTSQNLMSQQIFSDQVTEFKLHVFYETGAEPYTGSIGLTANDTWDITEDSFQALFSNHAGRTVTVPRLITAMQNLTDQAKTDWTGTELLRLAAAHAPALTNNTQINVSVFFVNGTYAGSSTILGVHFTGTRYAFIFKDNINSVGGTSVQQRYAEQATVTHEIGHIVGLVNNGVPMVSNHEDSSHPRHSTNSQCVMYWSVDSSTTVLSALSQFILASQTNLFGSESLADARAYHP